MNTFGNYSSYLNITDCHSIAELSNNITLQCQLIHVISDCIEDSFIDYADIAFCTIQSKSMTLLLFGTVLALLFLAISITADDFLCPLLITISKSLNISDNVAGVTFLALGNGAPDIFSSLSGISKNDANLVIGQLYGGGIFVTTIVVGSILIREQFPIMHRPLLRDIFFYLITTTLVFITFRSGTLTLYHSLAFIVIYLIYVAVVILSGLLHRRNERQRKLNNIAQEQTMPGEGGMGNKYEFDPYKKAPSKLSFKSLYVPGPGDDFEGVTLRRIKFRKYPLELTSPCSYNLHSNHFQNHQRRLTLYHIDINKNINESRKNSNAFCEDVIGSNNIFCTSLEYPRRLTISDTEFPAQIMPSAIKESIPEDFESDPVMNSGKNEQKMSKNERTTTKCSEIPTKFHLEYRIKEVWSMICSPLKKVFYFERENDQKDEEKEASQHGMEWKSFFLDICQLCEWKQSRSVIGKLFILIKSPIYLIFNLTIPVVDYDLELSGWNRRLILLNILLGPQCFLLITKLEMIFLTGVQLHSIALGISLFLLPIITLTSTPNSTPAYHKIFAYFGFMISVAWIYTIANEVVSLLKAVGIVFQISQFMLGLTFLAWGNSLGDLISNLTMAKNGFPRMAISACLGGPVLNMLLGMGIPYSFALLNNTGNRFSIIIPRSNQSIMTTIMYITITVSLLFTVIMFVFFTKFTSSKIHGFLLYTLYLSFILISVYTEYIKII